MQSGASDWQPLGLYLNRYQQSISISQRSIWGAGSYYAPLVEPYLVMPRSEGVYDGWNQTQGARSMDPNTGQWTAPDAYSGDVRDPATQRAYMWNNNDQYAYSDPSGYDPEENEDQLSLLVGRSPGLEGYNVRTDALFERYYGVSGNAPEFDQRSVGHMFRTNKRGEYPEGHVPPTPLNLALIRAAADHGYKSDPEDLGDNGVNGELQRLVLPLGDGRFAWANVRTSMQNGVKTRLITNGGIDGPEAGWRKDPDGWVSADGQVYKTK